MCHGGPHLASSEYSKNSQGGYEVFHVKPASPPKYIALIAFGAFLAFIGLVTMLGGGNGSGGFFFLFIGGCALAWFGWTKDYRPRPHRQERTFRVSPEVVESDGNAFKRDDIHRLLIKNGMDNDRVLRSWRAVPAVETSGANTANIQQRAKTATICHSLELETGGKAYMLAGGMDETTANGLLHDVTRALKFSVS